MGESLWQKCEFFVTGTDRVEICKNIDEFGQLLDFFIDKGPSGVYIGPDSSCVHIRKEPLCIPLNSFMI